jgi:formyltetrahydrofolate synthetase
MTRTLIVIAAFLTLSVPAAFAVPPADNGKPESPGASASAPGQQAEKNAAKKCKDMRKNNAASFATLYGAKPNAYGKCVSAQAKLKSETEAEASEDAKENAAKACKKERDTLGLAAFKTKYAPVNHPNGANAFGKCVSKLAKAQHSS